MHFNKESPYARGSFSILSRDPSFEETTNKLGKEPVL